MLQITLTILFELIFKELTYRKFCKIIIDYSLNDVKFLRENTLGLWDQY